MKLLLNDLIGVFSFTRHFETNQNVNVNQLIFGAGLLVALGVRTFLIKYADS